MGAGRGDGRNRTRIAQVIALGIRIRAGRFAEHIVAVGIALFFHLGGAFHRGHNGFTKHKLASHFLHGTRHGCTDHGFTHALDCRFQSTDRAGFVIVQHATRQHQRPRRRVHQRRSGLPHVLSPIRWRNFVFDQGVDCICIGNAQERFGQTHEGHALICGQPVFCEENLHQSGV